MGKTKSYPNLRLEAPHAMMRASRCRILAPFLLECLSGGFFGTKLRTRKKCRRCGPCISHIHEGVRSSLDPTNPLVGSVLGYSGVVQKQKAKIVKVSPAP